MKKSKANTMWGNPYTPGTQLWKVFNHLTKKGSISQVEAEAVYKIRRLASRIHEIREDGFFIDGLSKKDMAGQRYTRYVM